MRLTIYRSDVFQKKSNCNYPFEEVVASKEDMLKVIAFDHVCAKYKLNYRSKSNFEWSDTLVMDCDNDHSANSDDWISDTKFEEIFKDINYVLVFSRNHMKAKEDKSARPRFHVYFPIAKQGDATLYATMKAKVYEKYPFFDEGAVDAARFIFATKSKNIVWHEGSKNIDETIDLFSASEKASKPFMEIKEGSRNSTMSQYAAKILKRYGNTEEGYKAFMEMASKCTPPLEDEELGVIWRSALNFYNNTILRSADYVLPSNYANGEYQFKPQDLTDLGQAYVFASACSEIVKYSPSTDYLVYNGSYWEESKIKAQGLVQQLLDRQLKEAVDMKLTIKKKLEEQGVMALIESGAKDFSSSLTDEQNELVAKYAEAIAYEKYVLKMRESKKITATLNESKPNVEIDQMELDKNEFLLNTPSATYDLRLGLKGAMEHKPQDYITKTTLCSPNKENESLWLDTLDLIFRKDQELIDYVQRICGLALIGKVYVEALIIAYGEGGNGKSTFWNSIARVLGSYYGKISADILTVNCKRNVKPEMAEIKGKRILIAAESKEGARLDDSIVKELCSTDDISGEKKYKDPFKFKPCHTLVLYTNHLPRVSAQDDGIWRRLIVIPFTNKLTGSGDIKNYSDYLVENAGGAILSWLIEGARLVIAENYQIKNPTCVQSAIDEYKEQNDWFTHFVEDACEVDASYTVSSMELYSRYRQYCIENGEYARSTTDFYNTLQKNGYGKIVVKRVRCIKGLRLRSSNNDFDDAFKG